VDVFSLLPANQAVAFAKMSRSCCKRRFSRPAQPHQSVALGAGQAFFAWQGLAAVSRILRDPIGNPPASE